MVENRGYNLRERWTRLTSPVPPGAARNNYTITNDQGDDFMEVIYKLLKYTWEHRKDMISAHVVYKDFVEETVPLGRTIPWHPAAEKFWKEVGAIK